MATRLLPFHDRVTFTLDGETVEAERGEPLAFALVAAGKTTIARSPKFHRPRGPSCMRGACDGCLARVDETPNVMTCMIPATAGAEVVSQNRLGPRDADFLRMTDWFFPDGMNHHELFAGVPGIQTIMQGFARRVAGLGRLPVESEPARSARRRKADVLVVGAGPSGMAVASHLANAGRSVEVIDDQLAPGGGITALGREKAAAFDAIQRAFTSRTEGGGSSPRIRLRSRTVAGAMYRRDLLVVGEEGAEIVEARDVVLAVGAHDGALAFEGNDVPGVMSARAAGWLLHAGIVAGEQIVVIVPEGGGPFGESFVQAATDAAPDAGVTTVLVYGDPVAVRGSSRVKGVRVRTVGKEGKRAEKWIDADVVLIDAPRSPAYELCQQAGAVLTHEPRGYVVHTDQGCIAAGIWATGEVTGVPFDAGALAADASFVASRILSTSR